jgi:hypothetical protein
MAGVESKFAGIPEHRGPFVRKTYEVDRVVKDGSKTKRKVVIIDTNSPVSKVEPQNK